MKCIRAYKTNKVTRVSDKEAHKAVSQKTHMYARKEVWKKRARS